MISVTVKIIDKVLIPFIVLYAGIYVCFFVFYFLVPTW
jgi:hypothetical protein